MAKNWGTLGKLLDNSIDELIKEHGKQFSRSIILKRFEKRLKEYR